MIRIYALAIFIYSALIHISALWNNKAKQWVNGRKNWTTKLRGQIHHSKPIIWIHAASLGEFEQGRPIIEKLKTDHPNHNILLTFFSPSGYEIRKNYEKADFVSYLPLDTKRNARRFYDIVKPTYIIFIKYEFWCHYIREADRWQIPLYMASAIFRPSQFFFRSYGRWYLKILKTIRHFFVQNEESLQVLQDHGIHQVSISGDTRFDRVYENTRNVTGNPITAAFAGDHRVIIGGSSWPPDENMLIKYVNERPQVKLILAPHEISADHINHIEKQLKVPSVRYSQAREDVLEQASVLIIDNIGMLSSLYQYALIAHIGGGFGKGIHNILEAVTFGLPVVFGPNYGKFQEANDLIDLGGAHAIQEYEALCKIFDHYLENDQALTTQKEKNIEYIKSKTGATEKIVRYIFG